MVTEARSMGFTRHPDLEHLPDRDEEIPCITPVDIHPFANDRPFARPRPLEQDEQIWIGGRAEYSEVEGECALCGQFVKIERFAEDRSNLFSFIAYPHTRIRRYFVVNDSLAERLLNTDW